MNESLVVRIILAKDKIHKFTMDRPQSVKQLEDLLKERFNLNNISIMYEDKDFKDFITLEHVNDVSNLCTLKIVQDKMQDDEKDLFQNNQPSTSEEEIQSGKTWPVAFGVPEFDHEIQAHLHSKTTQLIDLPSRIRKRIVSTMAFEIMKYTNYPTSRDINNMCISLTEKYPMLRDAGPGGFETWTVSLKFKIGNLRKNMREQVPEIKVNSGKRSKANPGAPSPHSNIKKLRRGVVHRWVESPDGENDATLQSRKALLKEEVQKTHASQKVLNENMSKTWSARWKFILEDAPSVEDILKEWPAYRNIKHVFTDFRHLTEVSPKAKFLENVDQLIEKMPSCGQSQNERRNILMKCIEDTFDTTLVHHFEDELTMTEFGESLFIGENEGQYNIIIEEINMCSVEEKFEAYLAMMGYIWVFNLEYPSQQRYLLEYVQKVLLEIDSGSQSSKVQSTKKKNDEVYE